MEIKIGQIWLDGDNLLLIVEDSNQTISSEKIKIFYERVNELTVRWTTEISIKYRFYVGEID